MRQNVLIGLLLLAICSCTKETAVPAIAATPVPWKTIAAEQPVAGSNSTRATDCNNSQGKVSQPQPSQPLCEKYHVGYPVTGCDKNGGGGNSQDSCCRLTPPVQPIR
jgi:hypothetical protein